MKVYIIDLRPNKPVPRMDMSKSFNNNKVMSSPLVPALTLGSLGIADALEPFKLIIAEASDPVCFVGGAIGLYRIGIGDREGGFRQVLNATFAQVGFFIWPKIQLAIRAGMGS